jgi:hypothetical protein
VRKIRIEQHPNCSEITGVRLIKPTESGTAFTDEAKPIPKSATGIWLARIDYGGHLLVIMLSGLKLPSVSNYDEDLRFVIWCREQGHRPCRRIASARVNPTMKGRDLH